MAKRCTHVQQIAEIRTSGHGRRRGDTEQFIVITLVRSALGCGWGSVAAGRVCYHWLILIGGSVVLRRGLVVLIRSFVAWSRLRPGLRIDYIKRRDTIKGSKANSRMHVCACRSGRDRIPGKRLFSCIEGTQIHCWSCVAFVTFYLVHLYLYIKPIKIWIVI